MLRIRNAVIYHGKCDIVSQIMFAVNLSLSENNQSDLKWANLKNRKKNVQKSMVT